MSRVWPFIGWEKFQLFKVIISDERVDYRFAVDLGNVRSFPFLGLSRFGDERLSQYKGDWGDWNERSAYCVYECELYHAIKGDIVLWSATTNREDGDLENVLEGYRSRDIEPDAVKAAGRYRIFDPGDALFYYDRDPYTPGPLGHGKAEDEDRYDEKPRIDPIFLFEMQDTDTGELYVMLCANRLVDGDTYPQWYAHPVQKKYVPLYITNDNGETLPRNPDIPPPDRTINYDG